MAASERMRNGMRTAWSMYSLAIDGTTISMTATAAPTAQRSWAIGSIAWSAPYDVLNCPASR